MTDAGSFVTRPVRRPGQSEASWRDEQHQWARSAALAAIFRAIADSRPLPWVSTSPPAAVRQTADHTTAVCTSGRSPGTGRRRACATP